jgi:hypothetical protein
LHLCISAKSKEVFDLACHLVEDLLRNIYEEHRKFMVSRGRPMKSALQIKKIETFPQWNKMSSGFGDGQYEGALSDLPTPQQGGGLSMQKGEHAGGGSSGGYYANDVVIPMNAGSSTGTRSGQGYSNNRIY